MSHKKIALGAVAVLASTLTVTAVYLAYFSAAYSINPVAAVMAVAVALVGMAWFKRSSR